MSVANALLYLRFTSLANRLRTRLARLRQPKYLVGAVIGAAYLYYFFIRRVTMPTGPRGPGFGAMPPDFELLAAAVVLLWAALVWILPAGQAGLQFTEAEIAFLFPAPVKRRTLIHYRVLSSQLALVFSALILGFVSTRWGTGSAFARGVGWWLILATLSLHSTGASFAIARLGEHGISKWPRRLLIVGALALIVFAAFYFAGSAADLDPNPIAQIRGMSEHGMLRWLLALPRLLVRPFIAANTHDFLLALGPAILVIVAHYVWVIYSGVAFEEVSIAAAAKRAAVRASIQAGQGNVALTKRKPRREPFRLRATGRPEVAFVWKNLLGGASFVSLRTFAICAVAIIVGCRWLTSVSGYEPFVVAVFTFSILVSFPAVFFGPYLARNDLRTDLPNADILKAYPVSGAQIVGGQILAPIATLTFVTWLALLAATLTAPVERFEWLTPQLHIAITVALALLAPLVCAIQILVLNGLTILFPAWVQLVGNRGEQGFDVLGQRLMFMAGQILVLLGALLPAALIAGIAALITVWIVGTVAASVIASVVLIATLIIEVWVAVQWLGDRFEKFDLSAELRP
jgi:ABC-2 type transport system permease protein